MTRQKIPHDCEKKKEYAEQRSYVTKLGTLVTLLCFSMREEHTNNHHFDHFIIHNKVTFWSCTSSPFWLFTLRLCRAHSWESSAPYWRGRRKRVRDKNRPNYRKHVAADNKTLIEHLDNFTFVSSWSLPPFNVHHVSEHKHCYSYRLFLGRQLRVSYKAWPGTKQDLPLHWGSQTPGSNQRLVMSPWSWWWHLDQDPSPWWPRSMSPWPCPVYLPILLSSLTCTSGPRYVKSLFSCERSSSILKCLLVF